MYQDYYERNNRTVERQNNDLGTRSRSSGNKLLPNHSHEGARRRLPSLELEIPHASVLAGVRSPVCILPMRGCWRRAAWAGRGTREANNTGQQTSRFMARRFRLKAEVAKIVCCRTSQMTQVSVAGKERDRIIFCPSSFEISSS